MPFKKRSRQIVKMDLRVSPESAKMLKTASALFEMMPWEVFEAAMDCWARKIDLAGYLKRYAAGEDIGKEPVEKVDAPLSAWAMPDEDSRSSS